MRKALALAAIAGSLLALRRRKVGRRAGSRGGDHGGGHADAPLRLLTDNLVDYAIVLLDPEGRITSWNAGAERLLGYRADEVTGVHLSIFYGDEDRRSGHPTEALRSAAAWGCHEEEGWRVRKDGTRFWALVTLTAMHDRSGAQIGFGEVTRDLTERKAAEEELREGAERFRDLSASVEEIFWIMDPELQRILYLSPAYETVWGRPVAWAYENPDGWLDAVHPEDRSRVEEAFLRAATERYDTEYRILRPDGEVRWVHARGFPTRGGRGRVRRVIGIAQDVTERREREDRNRFLARASHVLASSLESEDILREVARLAVPAIADWCAVQVSEGEGLRLVEVAHRDPGKAALAREFRRRYPPDPQAPRGAYRVLLSGEPEVHPEVDQELLASRAPDQEFMRFVRELEIRSTVIVPMVARGRALGVITFIRSDPGRRFREEDVEFAADLAGRAALALDNARLHEMAQAERERSERVLESIDEAFFALDRQWRFIYLNRRAKAVFATLGEGTGELLGHNLWEAVPEAVGTDFERHYRAVMRERRATRFEAYYAPAGVWFEVNAYPVPDGLAVYFRDVTERKRGEAEREKLLERQRFLAEASSILASSLDYEATLDRVARLLVPALADYCLVDLLDEDGRLARVAVAHVDAGRERLIRAWRYPPTSSSESPALEVLRSGEPLLVPDVDDGWVRSIAQAPEHRQLMDALAPRSLVIVPLRTPDRTLGLLWLTRSTSGHRYAEEDVAFLEELARRATVAIENTRLHTTAIEARGEAERRAREEAALREAAGAVAASFTVEEVIQQIAGSAIVATNADAAFVERVDETGTESRIVAAAGELAPEMWGSVAYEGSLAQALVEHRAPVIIARLAESERPMPQKLVDLYPDWSAVAVPLLDSGEPVGALMILRSPGRWQFRPDEAQRALTFGDLAALAFRKVHLMEESERRREELERVSESRFRLMRGFSHDLKNPLGATDGLLELLEDGMVGEMPQKALDAVVRARRALRSALRLIDELLELARAEAGQIEIRAGAVDVREAAHDVAEEYRASAEAGGLDMELDLPESFPLVITDVARVRQVLGNLLSNAVKYTPPGGRLGVRVEAREAPWSPGSPWIAVDVSDTGPGIPGDQMSLLFQEFTRLESAGRKPGAGIGLAISLRVAQALGGDLTVRSDVGRGTTFTLWLPPTPKTDGGGLPEAATAPGQPAGEAVLPSERSLRRRPGES